MEIPTTRDEFQGAVSRLVEQWTAEVWAEVVERGAVDQADAWLRVHGGALLRQALGLALSARSERDGVQGRCDCGGVLKFRQRRPFVVHSVLPGREVEVRLQYGQCEECREGRMPLLRAMRTDPEGFTASLQQLALMAGVIEPYGPGSRELLERFAGVMVSPDKLQALVGEDGPRAEKFLEEVPLPATPRSDVADRSSAGEPGYVGIDGGMVFVDKRWQEVKLACLFSAGDRAVVSHERAELLARQVVAVRGDPAALGHYLWPRAQAAGLAERKVVVLGDGAPWIWNLVAEHFPDRVEILDWYHADEHISATARVVYGEGTDRAAAWRDQQLERLLDDRVDEVIAALRFLAPHQRRAAKRVALEELDGYLVKNRERMFYKTFRAAGYFIGSGSVESAVSHVVQQRMKRVGMRWHSQGADAMLALRSVYRSTGAWDNFWRYRQAA